MFTDEQVFRLLINLSFQFTQVYDTVEPNSSSSKGKWTGQTDNFLGIRVLLEQEGRAKKGQGKAPHHSTLGKTLFTFRFLLKRFKKISCSTQLSIFFFVSAHKCKMPTIVGILHL